MIVAQQVAGQRIAVLGMGRSGLSAARSLAQGGAQVIVWDDSDSGRAAAADQGFEVVDLTKAGAMSGVDLLITSPGIAHLYPKPHPVIEAALLTGVPVDNDVGLFFRSLSVEEWDSYDVMPKVVAVTGSNGKSTTSALIHHLLTHAGRASQLAGNIGRGVMDIDPPEDGGVVVLELSSYQTELARALTPDIAVLTNISADHLDRHAGLGGYFAAKRRLFAEGGPDRAIVGVDDQEGLFLAGQLSMAAHDDRVIQISSGRKLDGMGWSVFARKGFLSEYRKGRQAASIDLRQIKGLAGAHNHQNACAAYAVCRSLGVAPRVIEEGLKSFQGLPHRSQVIAEVNGRTVINDSKATNAASAAMALAAHQRVRWIVGGLMKDGGLGPLLDQMDHVAKAYVIGREAQNIAMSLPCEAEVCTDMAIAVAQAMAEAEEGDTILLAPAAASFDQYDNFEQRGDDFIAQVQKHLG